MLRQDMLRQWMLAAAETPPVRDRLMHGGGRRIARRFVAGETLADGLKVVRALNQRGLSATLDHLGEHTTNEREAEQAAGVYVDLLDHLAAGKLDATVSLKLTQLGLDLSDAIAERNLRRVVQRAASLGNFVRIDMESSAYTERTLAIFSRVFADFPSAVGPVIQAYLYRSLADTRALIRLGARVRLCKGAYAEPPDVAFPSKADVDANFKRLAELLLALAPYPALATHDPAMIEHGRRMAAQLAVGKDQFEFQMLYGIRRDLQEELAGNGYRVRIYVPFGVAWYPYLTRRLAERPANVIFVLGSLLREAVR